jgi:GGDEF domain-containing protein
MINASQRRNMLAAVLLFDVEKFRLINDTLGRHVRDASAPRAMNIRAR